MRKIIVTAFIFGLLIASLAQAQSLKFSKVPHTLSWTNKPISYKINPESIFIEAGEKTDMFRDPNVTYNTDNAPRLSFTADPNFVLTAEIHHDFTSKWDGGAIVLEADKMNWIKFCFEKDYTGMHRVLSVVTKDISDDCNRWPLPATRFFMKLPRLIM